MSFHTRVAVESRPLYSSTVVMAKGTDMDKPGIVRECFASYVSQDRDTAERLIGDPFVFTSPQDDHIDRTAYFERCFPTMHRPTTARPTARGTHGW